MVTSLKLWQFTQTVPDLIFAASRCAAPRLLVQILVVKRHRAGHRTEYFLADHRHVRPCPGDDRRLDEIAGVTGPCATGDDLGAVTPAFRDQSGDAFHLLLRDDGAKLG